MTRLSTYRSRKLRQRMLQESEIIGRDALRLRELADSIPAPSLEELRALLLLGQEIALPGLALVTDLLVQGYKWQE